MPCAGGDSCEVNLPLLLKVPTAAVAAVAAVMVVEAGETLT